MQSRKNRELPKPEFVSFNKFRFGVSKGRQKGLAPSFVEGRFFDRIRLTLLVLCY